MNFENWLMTSNISYLDFSRENKLELITSPNNSQLSDMELRNIIEPTSIASLEDFRELNEAILQRHTQSE